MFDGRVDYHVPHPILRVDRAGEPICSIRCAHAPGIVYGHRPGRMFRLEGRKQKSAGWIESKRAGVDVCRCIRLRQDGLNAIGAALESQKMIPRNRAGYDDLIERKTIRVVRDKIKSCRKRCARRGRLCCQTLYVQTITVRI